LGRNNGKSDSEVVVAIVVSQEYQVIVTRNRKITLSMTIIRETMMIE
jgi:hypothetical protein